MAHRVPVRPSGLPGEDQAGWRQTAEPRTVCSSLGHNKRPSGWSAHAACFESQQQPTASRTGSGQHWAGAERGRHTRGVRMSLGMA